MNIVEEVKALNLSPGSYAVFGSGPLAIRKLREARDIDVVVKDELFKKLSTDPSWQKQELRDHHMSLKRGDVDLYSVWAPGSWDIDELIRDAEMIEGVPFVRLESVLEWKQLRNLPKDVTDIALIEKYLTEQKK